MGIDFALYTKSVQDVPLPPLSTYYAEFDVRNEAGVDASVTGGGYELSATDGTPPCATGFFAEDCVVVTASGPEVDGTTTVGWFVRVYNTSESATIVIDVDLWVIALETY